MGYLLLDHPSGQPYVLAFALAALFADIIATETQSHALSHLLFALSVGLCAYNFFRAVTLDPGTCPKPSSDGELKSVRVLS